MLLGRKDRTRPRVRSLAWQVGHHQADVAGHLHEPLQTSAAWMALVRAYGHEE